MSWQPAADPQPGNAFACDAIDMVIVPRARDLGGFSVRRALPSNQRQMVGPFIFFDQMGPAEFLLGSGMDVRPHPHIGLSTVRWRWPHRGACLSNGSDLHQRLGAIQFVQVVQLAFHQGIHWKLRPTRQ